VLSYERGTPVRAVHLQVGGAFSQNMLRGNALTCNSPCECACFLCVGRSPCGRAVLRVCEDRVRDGPASGRGRAPRVGTSSTVFGVRTEDVQTILRVNVHAGRTRPARHLYEASSGSNVIPRRARPGLAGLRPHNLRDTNRLHRHLPAHQRRLAPTPRFRSLHSTAPRLP